MKRRPDAGPMDPVLLDHVPAAVLATDATGRLIRWNLRAQELFGWPAAEVLGRPAAGVLLPDPATSGAAELASGLAGEQEWQGEVRVRARDGTLLLCRAAVSPTPSAGGAAAGATVVCMDVTSGVRQARRLAARTAVTRALAEPLATETRTERLLRSICESLRWRLGVVWRVDQRTDVLRCLDVWADPSLDGAGFERLTREMAFGRNEGLPGIVWATGGPSWVSDVGREHWFARSEVAGRLGLHAAIGFPVRVGEQILGVIELYSDRVEPPDESLLETLADIGSQIGLYLGGREATEAAALSEAGRSALSSVALDAVVTMDHEGTVLELNEVAERTFGYPREEIVGRPMAQYLVPAELRERHRAGLTHYLETGEARILGRRVELTAMRSDGTIFPVELAVTRVGTTEPPTFTAFLRDITERKRTEEELRTSKDQLEAIFQGVAEGITVQDPTGTVVYANEAAARIIGFGSVSELMSTPVEGIRSRFEMWGEDGEPLPLTELPGRRALQGERAERVIRFHPLPQGEERWSRVKATPLFGPDGAVRFAVNIFHDITEEKRAQDTQQFLAEASTVLASSLDYDQTLRQIAALAVPRLADWCAIAVAEEDGSFRQIAVEHVDPQKVALAKDLGERYPPDKHALRGVPEVLRTGRAELYPEISAELLEASARDDEHRAILHGLGLRSAMVVPLGAGGRTTGAITFASAESGRRFNQDDLRMAEDLGRRAGLAMENARLFRERSLVADALQRSLLPPRLPEIPGMEVAARYHAAGRGNEVGGDFYDVFPTGKGSWALVIGDVCGKGPEAAAVTGLARHSIRAAAIQERRPSRVLATLNDAVIQQRTDHMFCTACYVRLKPNGRSVRATVCCAGHPSPIVLRRDGRVETAGAPGTLLGIFPDPELADRIVDLDPGDALVLYTDGVVEGPGDGEVVGRDSLLRFLASCAGQDAGGIARSIERAVLEGGTKPPRDDLAVLVLRVRA